MLKRIVIGVVLACLISTPVWAEEFEDFSVRQKCDHVSSIIGICYKNGFDGIKKSETIKLLDSIKNIHTNDICMFMYDIGSEDFIKGLTFVSVWQKREMYEDVSNNLCLTNKWFNENVKVN